MVANYGEYGWNFKNAKKIVQKCPKLTFWGQKVAKKTWFSLEQSPNSINAGTILLFRLSSIEWRRFQKYPSIRVRTLNSQSCKVRCIFREIEVLKYFKICLLLIFTEKFDSFIIELNGKILKKAILPLFYYENL